MTGSVVAMIIIGMILIFISYFISEKLIKKEDSFNIDLLTVDDSYEFSERELHIIKHKIEDVIAEQAKDILYETNESLSSMANEKTMALGDYAVAVCEEIERNHKEVMFLYSMLDDKQKEIMNTVKAVDEAAKNVKQVIAESKKQALENAQNEPVKEQTTSGQLTNLSQRKKEADRKQNRKNTRKPKNEPIPSESEAPENTDAFNESDKMTKRNSVKKNTDLNVEDILAGLDQEEMSYDESPEELEEKENYNDTILEMYRNGDSILDIAKQLGLGVGEVKLVVDLYQGE